MICVTLQNRTAEEILDLLENASQAIQMAEIRLDRCPLTEDEIETVLSSSDTPLIATCRVAGDGNGTWEEAEAKLQAAIEAGAAFIDLELEAPKEMGKRLRRACSEYGTRMIRSAHFFDGTPSLEILRETADRCRKYGGEIIKIAVSAVSEADVTRVLALYNEYEEGRLVAFAMGEAGHASRLECLRLGSPFTYAALTAEEAAAPGQWPYSEMTEALYAGGFLPSEGAVLQMPSSKSFAQRAIIAAALAGNDSPLDGYTPCEDSENARNVAEILKKETIPDQIHVGESGLLTRLMIPIVAALQSEKSKVMNITGEGTLLNRPLKGATEIMAKFGTLLRPLGEQANGDIKVPLSVQGPLLPGKVDISGKDGLRRHLFPGKDAKERLDEPKR